MRLAFVLSIKKVAGGRKYKIPTIQGKQAKAIQDKLGHSYTFIHETIGTQSRIVQYS